MDKMRQGMGAGGNCICPKCGAKQPHRAGIPCREERCPKCGTRMVREGSYHHELIQEKKKGGD
jgi:predicted amidophosphoribosyltransferase